MKQPSFSRRSKKAESQSTHPMCDWDGCLEEGAYKAPRSRKVIGTNNPEDYFHFCLQHVQSYNRAWDYFDGMTPEEIARFQEEAVHGHRPTWARDGSRQNRDEADLAEAFAQFWGETIVKEPKKEQPKYAPEVREAFAHLEIESEEPTAQEIRKAYKTLVKRLHPDMTKGDKALEARFKEVTHAYDVLKKRSLV